MTGILNACHVNLITYDIDEYTCTCDTRSLCEGQTKTKTVFDTKRWQGLKHGKEAPLDIRKLCFVDVCHYFVISLDEVNLMRRYDTILHYSFKEILDLDINIYFLGFHHSNTLIWHLQHDGLICLTEQASELFYVYIKYLIDSVTHCLIICRYAVK